MTITGTFMNKMTPSGSTGTSSQVKDSSFEQMLNDTSSKNKNEAVEKNDYSRKDIKKPETSKKKSFEKKVKNDKENAKPDKATEDSNPVEAEQVEKTENTEKTENADTVKETSEESKNTTETDEAIVMEVSQALGISPEALMEVLAALNIKPSELNDKQNVNLLVQELMGAENPIELLSMEGVKEMITTIEEAVSTTIKNSESKSSNILTGLMTEEQVENSEIVEEESFQSEKVEKAVTEEVVHVDKSGEKNALTGSEQNNESNESNENDMYMQTGIEFNMTSRAVENTGTVTEVKAENIRSTSTTEIVSQIIEKVKVDIKPGVSEIKMNLKPESLGEVSLRIASENGVITAHFVAESQRVKEIIETNFNQLQDVLSEQGINIGELTVSVSQGESERKMQEFLQGRAKSQNRISSIIASIDADGNLVSTEPDEAEVYENSVNYRA